MAVLKTVVPVIVVLMAVACGGESPEPGPPTVSPAPTAADGSVLSGCAMRVRDELEEGLDSRAVRVGPVAFVTFRVSEPRVPRPGAVGNFKVSVELRADARVTVSLAAESVAQASLLFDRGRLREDNAYTLADGARTVRFETCPGRPTTFVGAVVTAGPTRIPLEVSVEGGGPTERITLATP